MSKRGATSESGDKGDLARSGNGERNEHRVMLLSTAYGLNSSFTKTIHVGLRNLNSDEFDFEPCVKLSAKGPDGIYFNMTEWQQFQQNMEIMADYFDGGNTKPNPIIFEKIRVNFTTAYSARAILITYCQIDPAEDSTDANAPKKRKIYPVAIVMQRASFQGLENIMECVNANLSQLNIIASSVNECAKYLVNEIRINLPVKGYIESAIIKLALETKRQEIKKNVRIQLKDLTFLDAYFEIVFPEFIALCFNEIVRVIRMQRAF